MFARGRSKDRSSRKPTPPQASYMNSDQFANYLSELRQKRVTRPGGVKVPGASSARTSIDPAASAAETPAATSTTTLNTTAAPPFPRADSALSNRTTTTTLSYGPNRPSISTSRSRRSMPPPPASPRDARKSMQIDPTIVQPSATYIERGQRWMEREEAGSLRDALEDMDAAEQAKLYATELAAAKLKEEQMEDEERLQAAAQKEASELVHAHLYPEEIKRRQEDDERRRQTGYRYHLRKGSYQHARAASLGREYKGEDAIIIDLSRPEMPTRNFSDQSTTRSVSGKSMRRESSDHSSRPNLDNRPSAEEVRGRTPEKNGKSYGSLSSTVSGVASKSRSWSAKRKSGSKRNISGEVNTLFHPDQIWEEPESSRDSSKSRKKEKDIAKTKEDMYNDMVQPLTLKTKNHANHVQLNNEKDESRSPSIENGASGLPVKKIDRFEIFRNPPSQSRNPLYTETPHPRTRSPSPVKLPDVPMKGGKEIRNDELRKATTKSLKDRSEKLPTPTAVSDRLGRPIVSFDKEWAPADEKKLAEQKKLADLCPPVSAARTKLSEPQAGTSAGNNGALSAIEAAKRRIFGSAAQEQVSGSIRERRASRSPERGRKGRGRQGERIGESGQGGEEGKEKEREGHSEIAGGEADKEFELGKAGNPEAGDSQTGVGAEVKVAGKWIVETRRGVSTFRIEGEKDIKEQQSRRDGVPYRLDQSSASSSTTSVHVVANLRPTSKHGSKESTPRTSISQGRDETAENSTPVATPLVNLVPKPLPKLPCESAEQEAKPARHIVSIAPPKPVERTSTLMGRSPFARPRGESFASRRSIFQPEKSVPASSASVRGDTKADENVKLQPFGPSLLAAARPRPSFLTRTRSRSSVASHSPYSLKDEEPAHTSTESSDPAPPVCDDDRPSSARSKSSDTSVAEKAPRQSLEEPRAPRFAPRSPFARPSLGPTALSTPPELTLSQTGNVASRSPFGRPGGARSSLSTVSVPSRMNELAPSPSVRKSPFDRPKTSNGTTTHTRSSLGMDTRGSIGQDGPRPQLRQSFSSATGKAKLPWMRSSAKPSAMSVDENSRPQFSNMETFEAPSPVDRPFSRGKELPFIKSEREATHSTPPKILPDEPVVDSPTSIEVTVNTASVAALYQDVMNSPTKRASEVVVNTADVAEHYNLVLNEAKPFNEKPNVPALVATKAAEPVVEKKSSLLGARPLPMRPSGPRQSAPSARRIRHEQSVEPPVGADVESVPEKVLPAPPVVTEPPKETTGHKKNTSISVPSVSAPVLAPPTETLSEVRPPAPEDAMMAVKPLPTIYGPPRIDTPPGFAMHPPSLSIQAPSIAIRAPSPAPTSVSNQPMIDVFAPSMAVSTAPPQQSARPLPQPTRPLPTPDSSARPLPRPQSSSGRPLPRPQSSSGRPLPAPANARPIPHPSSRVQPPPNLARPSSDSTSHWSPAPPPAGGRATATCHACALPIEGRVIALAGLKEKWHPACMQCHVCSTALADFEISPEPSFARAARLARIEAREAGDYVAEGEATDGDKRLRFYCHLDWHEAFAPRCQHCKTPIIGEHITALGGKHYHYGHFFCCECGDPFHQGVPHVELDGYAWCTGCMEKRTVRRAPRCGLCKRNVVGEVVQALGKEFHAECFRCGDCQAPFVGGEIYLREDVGVSCRDCMERWAKR